MDTLHKPGFSYLAVTYSLGFGADHFGLVSMVSFVILYFLLNGINKELEKVMKADVVAIILLLTGFLLYKFKS